VSEAARDDDPLTPEERVKLRRLLRLLERGMTESVDAEPSRAVARDREPRPEDFERVARLRRRKGISNG
jgi:hypothetical protein